LSSEGFAFMSGGTAAESDAIYGPLPGYDRGDTSPAHAGFSASATARSTMVASRKPGTSIRG
jgi:hypothetical protein